MKTRYQEMFDEVHASGRLQKEVMSMTKRERTQVVKKVSVSFIIAAALAVILAGTALAAAVGVPQTLQEWFDKQWADSAGEEEMPQAQSEIIEGLVQPVGVASSGYGVTVNLEAVTPGENCLWMYLNVKGEKLKDQWQFFSIELFGLDIDRQMGQMGMTVYPMSETEKGEQDLVIQYIAPEGVTFLEGGRMTLRLDTIVIINALPTDENPETDYDTIEGAWALPFHLKPVEEQEVLTAESALVPGRDVGKDQPEGPMEIRDIRVTMTGLSFVEDAPDPKIDPVYLMSDVTTQIFLQMKDGTELHAVGRSRGLERTRCSWDLPVDLSKVESIRFGDVVVPLEKPKN